MYNIKSKHRKLKKGLIIVVSRNIIIEGINIPRGTKGIIVYAKNQVCADIWLLDFHHYKRQLITVDQEDFLSNRFKGVVLTLDSSDFAIEYSHEEHSEIMVEEERVLDIPYLSLTCLQHFEGKRFVENKRIKEYKLADIIETTENYFGEFTSELELEVVEESGADLEYVLTETSNEQFHAEKERVSEAFMRVTGIYYNFLGNLIEG